MIYCKHRSGKGYSFILWEFSFLILETLFNLTLSLHVDLIAHQFNETGHILLIQVYYVTHSTLTQKGENEQNLKIWGITNTNKI